MIFDLHRVGMQTGSTTRWLTGGILTGLVLVDIDPADVLSALDKLGELRATVSLTMPLHSNAQKKFVLQTMRTHSLGSLLAFLAEQSI